MATKTQQNASVVDTMTLPNSQGSNDSKPLHLMSKKCHYRHYNSDKFILHKFLFTPFVALTITNNYGCQLLLTYTTEQSPSWEASRFSALDLLINQLPRRKSQYYGSNKRKSNRPSKTTNKTSNLCKTYKQISLPIIKEFSNLRFVRKPNDFLRVCAKEYTHMSRKGA